jgi:outer membrane protein assembly factor BamB
MTLCRPELVVWRWALAYRSAMKRLVFCLLLSLLLIETNGTTASDWPQWRGSSQDGISTGAAGWFAGWPNDPQPAWSAQVGIGFSSVAVVDGRVFTLGNKEDVDTVYCLDAETGRVIWSHSYPCSLDARFYEGGPSATPTVHNERVFTFSKKGHLFAFAAEDGKVLWSRDLGKELDLELPEWSFAGSPLVHGDLLILNAGSAGTAVHAQTGEIAWTSGRTRSGYATPVAFEFDGKTNVAIFSAKSLVAVEPKTGRVLWEHPWESPRDINASDPIILGDKVFISSESGSALIQMGKTSVTVLWQHRNIMRNYFNPSVLIDGYLYGIDGTTHRPTALTCLDFNTGEVQWTEPGFGSGALMAADGKLIILDKGELIVVRAAPDRFTTLARAQVMGGKCWTVPVLAGEGIYCRNAAGRLIRVSLEGQQAVSKSSAD